MLPCPCRLGRNAPLLNQTHQKWQLITSALGAPAATAFAVNATVPPQLLAGWLLVTYLALWRATSATLTLPNLITAIRVIATTIALCVPQALLAFLLFLVAAATDFLDGWLARKLGLTSQTGAILDMEADQVLVFGFAAIAVAYSPLGGLVMVLPMLKYLSTLLSAAFNLPMGDPKPDEHSNHRARAIYIVVLLALMTTIAPLELGIVPSALMTLSLPLLTASFAIDFFVTRERLSQ